MSTHSFLIEPPANESDLSSLKQIKQILKSKFVEITTPDGDKIAIPLEIIKLMGVIIDSLGKGNALTIIPMEQNLTTQQAADILNVSRPFFVKLLESGEIPYQKVGRHRRVLMQDLLDYAEKRNKKRRHALNALTQQSQDLGLYD